MKIRAASPRALLVVLCSSPVGFALWVFVVLYVSKSWLSASRGRRRMAWQLPDRGHEGFFFSRQREDASWSLVQMLLAWLCFRRWCVGAGEICISRGCLPFPFVCCCSVCLPSSASKMLLLGFTWVEREVHPRRTQKALRGAVGCARCELRASQLLWDELWLAPAPLRCFC